MSLSTKCAVISLPVPLAVRDIVVPEILTAWAASPILAMPFK